jgi:dTDP-glucose pyrophosphorylase
MIGVVPAAGSGKRMKPFTRANPKELYHINRRAVIDHAIESLHKHAGVNKVLVVVGEHKGGIIDHLGDGSRLNKGSLKIGYLFQEERLGLAHAIYQAKDFVDEAFIAHVGDSFIHQKKELGEAVKVHKEEKPLATIIVKESDNPLQHGIVKIDKHNYVIDAVEKPTMEEAEQFRTKNGEYLVITALYIFNRGIFDYIEKTPKGVKDEYQITDSIKLALKDRKKIRVYKIKGEYVDIGNWESTEKAEEYFRKFKKGENKGD